MEAMLATEKQLTLMRELGAHIPAACTREQASDAIFLGRCVLCYALQIAWQEWRQDLAGANLRPVVAAVFSVPGMAEQIREIMDGVALAASLASSEKESAARSRKRRRPAFMDDSEEPATEAAQFRPDLHEDASYFFIKLRLQKLFPGIAALTPPPRAPQQQAHIYLATDSGFFDRVRSWLRDVTDLKD